MQHAIEAVSPSSEVTALSSRIDAVYGVGAAPLQTASRP
ncbi:hypothetical protein GGD41_005554 [Paraburkholderia bryophila]|uniref:Uncharacterized protein n=1 Tax=Paraburkholderia bryophila TaxID=420952 RepID=A0A7Y9WKM5_9BURK|nr:hypothetical protein [Paraburkholderia bryophila]NYH22586.1 hypothetical protein [Paraburkholderia bryophila]